MSFLGFVSCSCKLTGPKEAVKPLMYGHLVKGMWASLLAQW